jgi:hypothetical protein
MSARNFFAELKRRNVYEVAVAFFSYFNNVRVKDGGTVTLNADFDDFLARRSH